MKRLIIVLIVVAVIFGLAWLLPHSLFSVQVQTPTVMASASQEPTVSAEASPTPTTESFPMPQGIPASYENVSFVIPAGLAGGAQGASMPAAEGPLNPSPAFLQFALQGYQFEYPDSPSHPQVRLYPADEYAAVSSWASESLKRLRDLLGNPSAPVTNDTLPNVPYMGSAAQLYAAQVKRLPFKDGNGVRMISSYAQYPAPISQRTSFYHYEGLTQDGKYMLVVEMPVVLPVYADESNPGENGITYLRQDWNLMGPYYQSVTDLLNNASPDGFNPLLSQLDALVQSITVGDVSISAESPCPTPAAGTKLLTDTEDGYCLLYPAAYSTDIPHYIVINPNNSPGDVPGDAWVSIQVEKALGRTAQGFADEQIALAGPGFNIAQSTVPAGNEQAVVVDGLPGADPNRKMYVVHGDRLYTFYFAPWQPSPGGAAQPAPLEELYTMIVQSLRFLP